MHCFHPETAFVLDLWFCNGDTAGTLAFLKSRLGEFVESCCELTKKNVVRHYVDLIRFLRKIPKLPGVTECQLRTSRKGLSLDQNWILVDIADVINELFLIKFCFALKYDCFSFSLRSLLLYSCFHCLACLAKEITTTKKKTREIKFENNSKNTSQASHSHSKKHEIN